MDFLYELKRSKEDHERRMKLTTRFSYLIDKAIEIIEKQEKELKSDVMFDLDNLPVIED